MNLLFTLFSIRLPKIFYGSRTHKQIEQVIREFRKTAYKDKPFVYHFSSIKSLILFFHSLFLTTICTCRMTILSSREHTCIQDAVKGVSKTQLCNDLLDPIKVRKLINN